MNTAPIPHLLNLKSKTLKDQTVPTMKLKNVYRKTQIPSIQQVKIHNVWYLIKYINIQRSRKIQSTRKQISLSKLT